eukprot:1065155-Prymnesium_polylepis.1
MPAAGMAFRAGGACRLRGRSGLRLCGHVGANQHASTEVPCALAWVGVLRRDGCSDDARAWCRVHQESGIHDLRCTRTERDAATDVFACGTISVEHCSLDTAL